MASLVLGVAGSAIGSFFGPLGASIGWSIGSALGNLLDPQKVEGPRLTDLKLQASQYGQMLPILYGTIRVSGNVIWQTDLIEHSETSDGKGGPEVTTYSYTASFAVALCAGPIVAVTRIWADGRLVHDQTSYESTTSMPFTLYLGTETQEPDPRMEAEIGAGLVPAYRGTAYVVFEDIPLGDYGNRIPNLSFEVTTQAPVDVALHIVKQDSGTGGLPIQYNEDFPPPSGDGTPYVTSWSSSAAGKVVIKVIGGGGGHEYNADDLSYIGTTGSPGTPGMPHIGVVMSNGTLGWTYLYCGQLIINETPTHVYAYPYYPIQAGVTNAALIADSVWTDDDVNTRATAELAESAGITAGEYVRGCVLQQDRRAMFVFTGASSSSPPVDKWYKVKDGVVVASGTIASGFPDLLFGSGGGDLWAAAMFENNGKWLWHFTGAGTANTASTWYIDDDTGVLTYNAAGGTAGGFDLTNAANTHVSVYVLGEGLCGVVTVDRLAVISRFPTFDPGGPRLSDVVSDLSVRAGLDPHNEIDVEDLVHDFVPGYVISSQGPVRTAVGQLQARYAFDAVESDNVVKFVKRGREPVVTIAADDLAASTDAQSLPALVDTVRKQEVDLPRKVTVKYMDRDSDYQQGSQPAIRNIADTEMEMTMDLAIAMTAREAKLAAEVMLFDAWLGREQLTWHTSRKFVYLEPTDVIIVGGREVRITSKDESPAGVIKWEGVPHHRKQWIAGPAASGGEGFSQTGAAEAQPTDMMLLDIPLIDTSDAEPGYYVAAAGRNSTRWRGAALFKSTDGGTNFAQIGQANAAATMGSTSTALPDFGGGNVFDEHSSVTVTLTAGSGTLDSKTEALVLNGENEAIIGAEVVRFKNATLTATRTYVLTGLLRGRRGTEWAMGGHEAIERFCLLPVFDLTMQPAEIGAARHYKAVTLGSSLASADAIPFVNRAVRMKPLAPVNLGGGVDASGNVTINWTRRSRYGNTGLNGSAPLGESSERYVLQVWNSTFTVCARIVTGITSPTYVYTAAMQATDFGANQQTVYVSVGQLGTFELGYEAQAAIPGAGGSNGSPLNPVDPYAPPVVPPSAGTVDDNHMDNFRTLFNAGGRDRQLAYRYTQLGPVAGIGWYQRKQNEIIAEFFGGDHWAWALWVQDADLSAPLSGSEATTLMALAVAASS